MCEVGRFNDMRAVAVWCSATGTLANVGIRDRLGYLQSLFGQPYNMMVSLVMVRYRQCNFLSTCRRRTVEIVLLKVGFQLFEVQSG